MRKKQNIILLLASILLFAMSPILSGQGVPKLSLHSELSRLFEDMVFIKGGSFKMGCTNEQGQDCEIIEYPPHWVFLDDYYIGKYEVSVSQYRLFCIQTNRILPNPPEWGWNDNHPVVFVSWRDAVAFCNWLSNETGFTFRLPSEAEWEYAARGGQNSKFYKYCGANELDNYAWYADNSKERSNPIGLKKPNELGLYDMCGNVWEWCFDWLDDHYYKFSPKYNPRGTSTRFARVIRGGSFGVKRELCRVALRSGGEPSTRSRHIGFRLVMEPK